MGTASSPLTVASRRRPTIQEGSIYMDGNTDTQTVGTVAQPRQGRGPAAQGSPVPASHRAVPPGGDPEAEASPHRAGAAPLQNRVQDPPGTVAAPPGPRPSGRPTPPSALPGHSDDLLCDTCAPLSPRVAVAFYNQALSFGLFRGKDRKTDKCALRRDYHKHIQSAQPGSGAIYKVRLEGEKKKTDFGDRTGPR